MQTPPLINLLEAASREQRILRPETLGEDQILWAVETGLGPLLLWCIGDEPGAAASPLWPWIKGAELAARMLAAEQMHAMAEIIDACQARVRPLTLLKGISVCDRLYSEPHLRPMRDIDVLVEDDAFAAVESSLFELGYVQTEAREVYQGHHHSAPFVHPQTEVWVEVHRGLFPPGSVRGSDLVFGLENLRAQIRPSLFQGRTVTRLSDELQVVYLASHWAASFKVIAGIGGMVAMLDTIYLLKRAADLRWEQILSWLDGSVAATDLYLLLTYLDRYRLIDIAPRVLHDLRLAQRSLGALNLRIVHGLIDRYVVGGQEFGALMSARSLEILWKTLLAPGPPFRNLMLVPWNMLALRDIRSLRAALQRLAGEGRARRVAPSRPPGTPRSLKAARSRWRR